MRLARLVALLGLLACIAIVACAKRDAQYVGSEECKVCHEDTHKALLTAYFKSAHAAAMTDAAAKPDAIVAKFDGDGPVKKSDIRYVLGKGKAYQNYLDKDLKLLPGRWLVNEQKWVAIEPADGAVACVGCHTTNFDPETRKWTQLGVGCEGCHGPGGAHAESMEAKDVVNLAKLDNGKQNMVCGQCHALGTDPSGKYAFSVTFVPGQDLHQSFKLKDAQPSGANQQYNEFIASKHASGGMKCTSCHDTHGDKAKGAYQTNKPINELCLACHSVAIADLPAVKDIKSHALGAKPEDTCATCHMRAGSHKFHKLAK